MCFSPEASFIVGGALFPAGAYCLRAAWTKNRRLLPLAFLPIGLGIQQIAEGFVWRGLQAADPSLTRGGSLVFLFFALAFWPFWWPFVAAILETRPRFRRAFTAISIIATGWFWVLFHPLLVGPESLLTTEIVHHSIRYAYPDLAVYEYVPRPLLRLLYLLCAVTPMALGSGMFGRTPGLLLLVSAVIAAVSFDYAFVSVWCFFAAIVSSYLCVLFRRVPAASSREGGANPL